MYSIVIPTNQGFKSKPYGDFKQATAEAYKIARDLSLEVWIEPEGSTTKLMHLNPAPNFKLQTR